MVAIGILERGRRDGEWIGTYHVERGTDEFGGKKIRLARVRMVVWWSGEERKRVLGRGYLV